MNIIDPRGLTAVEWCDYTADNLAGIVAPMKISGEAEWKDWARHAVQNPRLGGLNPPNPNYFEDWREWADRFNQAIYTLRV